MPDADRLRQRLEFLREKFAGDLPGRLTTLTAQCEAAFERPINDVVLRDLSLAAHTLKGTSATYGYGRVCHAAARLEETFESFLSPNQREPEAFRAIVTALLVDLNSISIGRDATAELTPIGTPLVVDERHGRTHAERMVYLLEEDTALCGLISAQLEHYGYRVLAFSRPDEFRDTVIERPPDALIIEIALGGSDSVGLSILTELGPALPKLPATILCTSRTDLDARVGAVRAGAAAYFTKPVDITDLVAALDRLTWIETAEPYRILIVDDDAASASYHSEILRFAEMETRIVVAPEAVMEQLTEFRPDLLLLDLHMPRISGADLAAVIRQQSGFTSLPIAFLSMEQDPHKHLATIISGADDFLTKPIDPNKLIASITARAQRARLLHSLTIQDPMTKLLNHTACKEHLGAELARAKRHNTATVFALIDIDHFKHVNDTYGHPVGDAVIWGLSRLLRQRLRQSDVVGRYGGEEFAIIMPETSLDQAVGVLEDLRLRFSAMEFMAGDRRFSTTFSGGATLTQATDRTVDVIRAADEALYAAKRSGRNRICVGPALASAQKRADMAVATEPPQTPGAETRASDQSGHGE